MIHCPDRACAWHSERATTLREAWQQLAAHVAIIHPDAATHLRNGLGIIGEIKGKHGR